MKHMTNKRKPQWVWGMVLMGLLCMTTMMALAQSHRAPEPKPAAATAAATGENLDLNALPMPTALFIGTPIPPQSYNLEPLGAMKEREHPFLVPRGVKLVSLKKEVTASDKDPIIGEIAMVTDGDKVGTDGSFVELGPFVHWVQIDLQAVTDVYALRVWHFFSQARAYHDVVIRCADDADFVTGVRTLFNNDHDNSAGLGIGKDREYIETNKGRLFECKGQDGKPLRTRYLRFYSNGNTANEMNHYVEIDVFGVPAGN